MIINLIIIGFWLLRHVEVIKICRSGSLGGTWSGQVGAGLADGDDADAGGDGDDDVDADDFGDPDGASDR